GAVLDEHVEFLERTLVEQKLDALAGGQFAAGVLRLDALLAAAQLGARAPFLEGVQDVLHERPPRPYMSATILPVLTGRLANQKPLWAAFPAGRGGQNAGSSGS